MNTQKQVSQPPTSALHPLHGIEIPDDRRTFLAQMLRFVSWLLLLGISTAALGGAWFSLWYLGLTLEEGWAWFKDARTPPLLDATRQFAVERNHNMVLTQWQRYAVAIDLSGFTWVILLTASWLVAVRGLKHTLFLPLSKSGRGFWSRAFVAPRFELIPPGWAKFWVRSGLLGNLVSFFLVAVFLMQNMPTSPEPLSTHPTLREVSAEESLSAESTKLIDDPAAGPSSVKKRPKLEMNSMQFTVGIFLALCAALVSTLVGVFAAYVIAPVLNSLNDRALGLAQLEEPDPGDPMEQFQTRIALASQSVAAFQFAMQQLTALFAAVPMLESSLRMFQGEIKTLGTDLKTIGTDLKTLIEQARQVPETVKKSVSELATGQKQLQEAVKESTTLVTTQCTSVSKDVSALVKKLEPLSTLPATIGKTAEQFGQFCNQVTPVMLPARQLIEELTHLVKSSGDTIASQTKVANGVESVQTSQLKLDEDISRLLGVMETWQRTFKDHLADEQRRNKKASERINELSGELDGLQKKTNRSVTNHTSNGSTHRTNFMTRLRDRFLR